MKIHEWIRKYTEEGEMDIVTGYFTIGAIGYLSNTVNDKIERFRLLIDMSPWTYSGCKATSDSIVIFESGNRIW